jgi:putative oxidoreductase
MNWIKTVPVTAEMPSLGLLAARVVFGGLMLFGHGWPKLMNFSAYSASFFDPIGLGGELPLALAVFAEVLCALLITIGLVTRGAAVPLIVTMAVAAFVVHGGDPLFMGQGASKEPALLYLGGYLVLLLAGPGKYSVDAHLK